ncbi:MAG: serine/threonine-protein kinase [Gemmataceae bacterium]
MPSHPKFELPGSSARPRERDAESSQLEDALAEPGPSTDDTPTIISRNTPRPGGATPPPSTSTAGDDSGAGLRGRRLAHFELIEPIGVGGMAAVIRALDTQLDRFVALKILPPEMAADEENVRRFHQEARSAAKLDHENVARVFFCGEDQRLHFIAFEFVEGENLRHLIERRGKLPVAEAVQYMLQVAAGLAHAARRGVVHRDIKPSNIIVTPNGRAKLVDMGLARSLEPRTDDDLTQSGVTLGTFDYISPEQALEPRDADVRSDIYSLGCTFYHALTGRPPVPEGTAAKKLHHHQHVNPVDPRQFVPDLPVEVVAILDRTMAKNPSDRIQSPELLVQMLLAVARQLGAAPEVPEGVLSVETTVPSPPSNRPLLWAAAAVASVVALVLALDQVPTGVAPPSAAPEARPAPADSDGPNKAGPVGAKGQEDQPPAKPAEADQGVARYFAKDGATVEDLVQWLERQTAPAVELLLAGELDLSKLQSGPTRGLLLKANKVTIRPRDAGQKVVLKFNYDANTVAKEPFVALALEAQESLVEGVQFLIDARGSPDITLTGLQLRGGRKHTVRGCEFVQAEPPSLPDPDHPFASLVARADRGRVELSLADCVFLASGKLKPAPDAERGMGGMALTEAELGGQIAVVRQGPVAVTAENCAFGPHAVAFRLEEPAAGDPVPMTVKSCSLLLAPRRSAAFEIGPGAAGRLVVESCLFSRAPGEAEDGAVLLRQEDDRARVAFQGRDNAYHDLDGFWSVRDGWQRASWKDFRDRLTGGSSDEASRLVLSQPWEADPDRQRRLFEEARFAEAFKLNLKLASLRRPGRAGAEEVVGATKVLGESWLPRSLPRIDDRSEPVLPRFLVVEPQDEGGRDGVYNSLAAAVNAAKDKDTILLRHNGEIEADPIALSKKGLNELTIKPARKFRPVLTLGDVTDTDAVLFRVYHGKLTLEGLEFKLKPGRREFRTQAVVSLVGDGECVLKDCAATLPRGGDAAVALATVAEAGKAMKTETPGGRTREQGPKLAVEGCFVRGEADLVWSKASRPFALDVKDSLLALGGSVVNLEPSPESAMAPASQEVRLALERVTTYLGGHLVRLSTSKDPRGLLPVRCRAEGCLFFPASTGRTLVQLEGPDGDDKAMGDKFVSKDWRQNGYGAFANLLTQETADGMATPVGMDKWRMRTGDDSSLHNLKLERMPPATLAFSRMEPGQFKPPDSARDLGAPAKLPRPAP